MHTFPCNTRPHCNTQCDFKELERVEYTRYLGVTFDEKLTWNHHILNTKTKDFLLCIDKIFSYSKWIGIPVYSGKIALCWAITLLLMIACLEAGAIWKLVRALTGLAINTTGGHSLVARLSGSIFYANSLFSLILTWKFIKAWKGLSKYWIKAEVSSGLYLATDQHIKRRVEFISKFVAFCACAEHIMSMFSATGFNYPPKEYLRRYILNSHGFLLQTHEYNLWLAVPLFILSKVATILWNFQDLVIILISMGLTSRYYRLNLYAISLIKRKKDGNLKDAKTSFSLRTHFWRKLRESYACQANLVRMIDKQLGPLILLSNMNNLYFTCLQLYLGIRVLNGTWVSRMYYIVSLAWRLFRACSVVLAAADISLHSQRLLPYLNTYPSLTYNLEVKRLTYQLTHDTVALSGMGLFALNRQNLLEVVAAIVRYELILLQFDK